MEFLRIILATGISLVFLSLVFIPMEKVFPAKTGQPIFRRGWLLDLFYFFGQYLVWGSIVLWILLQFNSFIGSLMPLKFRTSISSLPISVQAILVLFLSDLLVYWGHRLQHKVDFLWRFHKVHHSAEHLDWLAAHREHPIDSIYTIGLINLPAFVFGFDLNAIAAIVAFRGIWAIYIHSNVRLPLGPLKILVGSPELHHWHHDIDRDSGNYANISPLMDKLFGTYVDPDFEPQKFGVKESIPRTYFGQLLQPILPASIWKRVSRKGSQVADIETEYHAPAKPETINSKPETLQIP